MDLGIRGRKALVNGGSAGLGKGAAKALAAEGVELYISARGQERLEACCEEIASDTGASVTPIAANHASDEGREKILSVCPDPDILVGTCSPAPFTPDFRKVSVSDWEKHLAIGLIVGGFLGFALCNAAATLFPQIMDMVAVTYFAVCLVMAVIVCIASAVPALRITRLDPGDALRHD